MDQTQNELPPKFDYVQLFFDINILIFALCADLFNEDETYPIYVKKNIHNAACGKRISMEEKMLSESRTPCCTSLLFLGSFESRVDTRTF